MKSAYESEENSPTFTHKMSASINNISPVKSKLRQVENDMSATDMNLHKLSHGSDNF